MSGNSGMMSSSGGASAFDGDSKKTKSRNNFFTGLLSRRPKRQQPVVPDDSSWMTHLQDDLRGMVMKLSQQEAPSSMIHPSTSFVGSVVLLCLVMG